MRKLIIISSLVVLIASCKKSDTLTPVSPDPAVAIAYSDVGYGTDPLQKMDIDLPAGRTINSTKTIVVIHGGAWVDGDKTDMTFVVDSIKKRSPNFAFINLNYRLAINSTTDLFPTQEQDVKSAIEYYLSKSVGYGVSQDLIVLGASAGAHLALLHSYKNDPNKHVKAVVDFFGPTDLEAIFNQGLFQEIALIAVIGQSYSQDSTMYKQSSPINFVNNQSPPTIALQGGLDDIVIPEQTTALIDKLTAAGVSNQLITYPDEGHGFTDADNSDALNKILPFLAAHVK